VSTTDEKISSSSQAQDSTKNGHEHRTTSSTTTAATSATGNNANEFSDAVSLNHRTTSMMDYPCHRERLAKELKDYEDRWLAQRNFLLYSQSLAMKGEERERFVSQINASNHVNEDQSSLHQLQLQQQLLHRLSKDERDRFFAAALYQQQNPYNFHAYPWLNQSTSAVLSPTSTLIAPVQSSSDSVQHAQPKSPSSDDSGNQSNSGSTTEW
jgi:hypothetical protein